MALHVLGQVALLIRHLLAPENTTLYSPDKRLKFTVPAAKDDADIAAVRSDPLCRKYSRYLPESITPSQVAGMRAVRGPNPGMLDFVVSIRDNDDAEYEFAAICNVALIDATHMWGDAGLWISSKFHGKGLSTPVLYVLLKHVIEDKKLHRVSFMTGEDNAPMRGWLEKVAGIRKEGQFVECWKDPSGSWTDVVSYGLTADEWEKSIKPALEKKMTEKGLGLPKAAST